VGVVLFLLGAAVAVFGAVVLLRFPDRPGGQVSILGVHVSSLGAGLPLIAIGVVVMLTAALSVSRDDTKNTPLAGSPSPLANAPTGTQSSPPSTPVSPSDPSQLPEDNPAPPGSPTYTDKELGDHTYFDLDRAVADTEPSLTDELYLDGERFFIRDDSIYPKVEAAIVPDEEATAHGCANASRRIVDVVFLNEIEVNQSLCIRTSQKRWAVVKEVDPDNSSINDPIAINIWLR
jgi:hypothetical protein